jgi:hypothetical protein
MKKGGIWGWCEAEQRQMQTPGSHRDDLQLCANNHAIASYIDDVYITEGVYSLVCFQNYTLVYTKIFGIVCTKRLIGIIFT